MSPGASSDTQARDMRARIARTRKRVMLQWETDIRTFSDPPVGHSQGLSEVTFICMKLMLDECGCGLEDEP
jgi:hypothetical protein